MPYISYDPNKPGDRERAADGCFIGPIIILGSVASIVFYGSTPKVVDKYLL